MLRLSWDCSLFAPLPLARLHCWLRHGRISCRHGGIASRSNQGHYIKFMPTTARHILRDLLHFFNSAIKTKIYKQLFGFAPTRRRAGSKDLLQPDGAVGPVLWISLVGIVGGDQPRQWALGGVRHGAILGRCLGCSNGGPSRHRRYLQVVICPPKPGASPQPPCKLISHSQRPSKHCVLVPSFGIPLGAS